MKYPENTTDLSPVTENIIEYRVRLVMNGVRSHNFIIDRHSTDCIGNCRSSFHTITTTTVPIYKVGRFDRVCYIISTLVNSKVGLK